MSNPRECWATMDANEAVARVAYRASEVIAIYPITPSSPMAELADEWSSQGRENLWREVPHLTQMQSEAGVAGAVHGALQAGAMTTTFTASQGLLLMIPVMYKIAGELLPFCMHVTARAVATHALSIFGDHSDVMACRQTGFAMLASNSVQEAQDLAAIAHAATLRSRVPFLHFFDGFRTSHEINKIQLVDDDTLRAMISPEDVRAFRQRALTPDRPSLRGTAQNPDVFFQAREASNPFYAVLPQTVQATMDQWATLTGRAYRIMQYTGHPEAEHVVVVIGSAAETLQQVSDWMNQQGGRTGVLQVRLFRPFSVEAFAQALPASVKVLSVLDRTKEPGAVGEPLYQDVCAATMEAASLGLWNGHVPQIVGGRYGLGSKEFNPAMARAVFDNAKTERPRNHFTIGIMDDVSHTSLPFDSDFCLESPGRIEAIFVGLGSDGTVGANKNTIKIIGEETPNYAQGYFVYDSKKSGAMTTSHLRFGPTPIRAPYLIERANFLAVHQFHFLEKLDLLAQSHHEATVLLNSPYAPEQVWNHLPTEARKHIVEKRLRVYTIDAYRVARENGMGGRINTVMQTCFFALSGVLPREVAVDKIKETIRKTYGKKGEEMVQKNFAAVDATLANLQEVPVPHEFGPDAPLPFPVPEEAPDFVKRVTAVMLANQGDRLPVSAMPVDGVWPVATARWEKRNLALEIPLWDPAVCIQCNKCVMACPHAAIRAKFYPESALEEAPEGFLSHPFRSQEFPGHRYTIQVAPEDCTGCSLCVAVCPAKNKQDAKRKAINMAPQRPVREREIAHYDFFLRLPNPDRTRLKADAKHSQFLEPLFEYSGACAGCGETPYIKLLTQLFGDRLLIANATGCSSIYGGNLPTTPYTTDACGRGPAWANSLFENNAEFGFGLSLAAERHRRRALALVDWLAVELGPQLVHDLTQDCGHDETSIARMRQAVHQLKQRLTAIERASARELEQIADYLVPKSVWIIGGDGWAYDIGYGGLDHVIASGANVNVLVLDTQVYSNTGGQMSKATPLAAVAKFAFQGKASPRKHLGEILSQYGSVYVAQVAMGAKDSQTVEALREAESFPGPSLVIAYSHCIAHGFNLSDGMKHQKTAVETGLWPLFRFDPRRANQGQSPFRLESAPPKGSVTDFLRDETRFRMLEKIKPSRARELAREASAEVLRHYHRLQSFAQAYEQASQTPAATTSTKES